MAGKFSRKKQEPGRVVGFGRSSDCAASGGNHAGRALGAPCVQGCRRVRQCGLTNARRTIRRAGKYHATAANDRVCRGTTARNQTRFLPEPEPEPEPKVSRVTLMALGDNLIHNTAYWSAELPDGGYDFTPFYAAIAPVVSQYDIACINQETILVGDPALYANYPNFGSPTQVADALAKTGFSVVTGATNHCFDKGETGILDTCRYWREHYPEITTLGIHDTETDAKTLRVIEKNGTVSRFLIHLRSQRRRAGKGVDG